MSAEAKKARRARRQIVRVHERRALVGLPPFSDAQAEQQIVEARRRLRIAKNPWGYTSERRTVECTR
jgi:hypothetical protein